MCIYIYKEAHRGHQKWCENIVLAFFYVQVVLVFPTWQGQATVGTQKVESQLDDFSREKGPPSC